MMVTGDPTVSERKNHVLLITLCYEVKVLFYKIQTMKPLKIIPLLFFILLLSCDTNSIKNQEKKNDINYDEKGIIPRDHTFYDA